MASISTNTQEMRRRIEEVRNNAVQFNNIAKEIFEEGNALDNMWDGTASDTFMNRLRNDQPKFDQLFEVMKRLCDAVEESAQNYDDTEKRINEEMLGNSIRTSG